LIYPATDETIARAASLLASGQLIGMPTETVYGLAANAWDAVAVRKIFEVKSRPPTNPLIVHVAGVSRLADAIAWPPSGVVRRQLDAVIDLWPGPLTIVCDRSVKIPDEVTASQGTVAVRIPAHDVAIALLEACPFPLAAPSANRSKYISPTKPEHLYGPSGIGEAIAMVLDGGACQWGVESTILRLGEPGPKLLRPGAISLHELAERLGVTPLSMLIDTSHDEALLEAPGMMREHYSPSTRLELLESHAKLHIPANIRAGRIAFQPLAPNDQERYQIVEILSYTGNLEEIAHHLFSALRKLDLENLDVIHCDTCEPIGMGHAIMDRLNRAAARFQG